MTHAHVWQFQAGLIQIHLWFMLNWGFQASEVMLQHGGFQSMVVALLLIHFRLGFSITISHPAIKGVPPFQEASIHSIHPQYDGMKQKSLYIYIYPLHTIVGH